MSNCNYSATLQVLLGPHVPVPHGEILTSNITSKTLLEITRSFDTILFPTTFVVILHSFILEPQDLFKWISFVRPPEQLDDSFADTELDVVVR